MRLKRIVAERFGRLEGTTLGDLGPGLNVVLGPNEAGKTSFSALVRHVLYGYPTKRDAEAGYESKVGKRLGRLVFVEDQGEWAIERTEGPHGGPFAIHVLSGLEHQQLLDNITHGISREAFRIVFGFGLEQLAAIEAKKGSGDDILSPLYAAQVGLATSPSVVRRELVDQAEKLWVKQGKTRELNALKSEIAQTRREISELEADATRFAEDRRRLEELGQQLQQAHVERDRLSARAAALLSVAQRITGFEERVREADEAKNEAEAIVASLQAELDGIVVDERVLNVATQLEALLDDVSLFKDRLTRVDEQVREAASARSRAADTIEALGLSAQQVESADIGPATQAGIETWRDTLATLASQAASSRRAADSATDAYVAATGQATESTTLPLRRSGTTIPGVAIGMLGAAIAAIGAIDGAWMTLVLGLMVLVAGVVVAIRASLGSQPTGLSNERIADLRRQADATQATADRDSTALETARDEWRSWLDGVGLNQAAGDPAAVSMIVSAVKEHRSQLALALRHEATAREEKDRCEAYRAQLLEVTSAFMPEAAAPELVDVPILTVRGLEALRQARSSDAIRRETQEKIVNAQHEVDAAVRSRKAASAEQAELLKRHGDGAEDVHALASSADAAEREAREAVMMHDQIAQEYAVLKGRLDAEEHHTRMAGLRLDLTGLEARREVVLEEYAVLKVSEQLMARAQAFNEQARQPEVIRRASEILEQITDGRYVRVSPPAEDGRFRVFDAASEAKDTAELSTGTAQQLYLAVRIALVEQLDDLGAGLPVLMDDVLVNFDPERRAGTARAVAELARHRQVVLFTCHPEVADLFASIESNLTTLVLDRC